MTTATDVYAVAAPPEPGPAMTVLAHDAVRVGWDVHGRFAVSRYAANPASVVLDERPADPRPAPTIEQRPWRAPSSTPRRCDQSERDDAVAIWASRQVRGGRKRPS